ncbi:MAG: hypothetical protein WA885_01785 [Phormidesmis sp.]
MPGHPLKNTNDFSLAQLLNYLEKSERDRFLISSEDFDFLQPSQVAELRHLLIDYDVQIVMYVRNPVNAVYSHWQEGIKHGDIRPFKDYCEQILAHPRPLDYCRIANTWSDILGQEAMSFVIYENLVADGLDIALYFLNKVLGIAVESQHLIMPERRVNPSSNMGVIELLRQLNEMQVSLGKKEQIAGSYMTFLKDSSEGQRLRKYLQNTYAESADSIDLAPLKKTFSEISERFLMIHKKQTKNIYNEENLFMDKTASNSNLEARLVDSKALAEKINIKKLHSLLV